MGPAPNRVGSALALPVETGVGVGVPEDFEGEEVSQRCRKRVTSSWSSMVFMCLRKEKEEEEEDPLFKINH